MENIIAIGDIHGQYESLVRLLQKINVSDVSEFVFLGDYIDRGPDSKNVIDFLIDFSKSNKCIFLKGNHEELLLNSVNNPTSYNIWLNNGGVQTIKSYGGVNAIKKNHWYFFERLSLYYEKQNYLFVHAGINPEILLSQQTSNDFLWIREEFISKDLKIDKKVIFGHTPNKKPLLRNDKIGIDTGAGYKDGYITAIKLPEESFIFSK